MKKFASLLLTGAMVASMAAVGAVSVSATEPNTPSQSTGSVSLTKKESVDTTKTVEGAEFSAYRVLDFDGSVFTLNESFADSGVTVNSLVGTSDGTNGYVSFGTTSELEAQISKIQQFTRDNTVTPTATGTTDGNGRVTLGNLPLGVYLIAETYVPDGYVITTQSFLVSIPQWDQDANEWVYDITASPKNKNMAVDKTVTTSDADEDVYNIGDVMKYNISADVPDYGLSTDYPTVQVTDNMAANDAKGSQEGVKKFNLLNLTFTDTMSKGLTLDKDSITVKVNDVELSVADSVDEIRSLESAVFDEETQVVTLTEKSGDLKDCAVIITDNNDGTTTLQVVISWMAVNDLQGKSIDIDYEAQLNANAVVSDANTNSVKYQFTNDPTRVTGQADDPTIGTTTDENEIYTYQADVSKLFNGKSATDAEVDASTVTFELQSTSGQVCNLVKLDDGSYTIWTGTVTDGKAVDANGAEVGDVVTSMNPTTSGSLTIKGFKDGDYQLVETASASGYSLITSPIVITLEEVYDENTNKLTGEVKATVKNTDGTKTTLVHPDAVTSTINGTTTTTYYLGEFKLDINNTKSQFNLPTTGGLGLWMFTIAGGVIMAGAIIFIAVLRKKKSA